MKHPCLGRRRTNEEIERIARSHLISPTLSPSNELAYFLGAFLGDGYAYRGKKGNYYVQISPGLNKEFAEKCVTALQGVGLHPHMYLNKNPTKHGWKPQWMVKAYSKVLVSWLENLSINKIEELLKTAELKKAFIRGFYDAEGCLHKRKDRPSTISLSISNTKRELIDLAETFFKDLGYSPRRYTLVHRGYPTWKPLYTVSLLRRDEIRGFLDGSEVRPS